MEITELKRTFVYNGITLADPSATMAPAAVKDFYGATYPELVNAEIEGPVRKDGADVYTFRKAVGTKGSDEKKPRMFYWEDAEDCWCPVEGLEIENIIGDATMYEDGEVQEFRFKRIDMTDAEFNALPEHA